MTGKHIIRMRQSSMRAYRKCPRYHKLTYRDGVQPKVVNVGLNIGTIVHAARAEWLRTFDGPRSIEMVDKAIAAEVLKYPSLQDVKPKFQKNGVIHYGDCRCLQCIELTAKEMVAYYINEWPRRFPEG